ncbi:MAG: carboxylate-amine ligase [Pseudomonadota bacterium]
MRHTAPTFTIGVEEEYLIVDKITRDLVQSPPKELMQKCEEALKKQVSPEFLKSQIEVGTCVCHSIADVRQQLKHLRSTISEIVGHYNLAPIASSTHPFALWAQQAHTDKERYNELAHDLQHVVRRMLICGMHVHIGIEDDDLRIDIMNQACYFLPHLLALSTSSPFWQGEKTGLKSYRLSVFDELPRTGMPTQFQSYSEYERTIKVLQNAGLIEDASKLWWDLRPSVRFPTLEMRITDTCPLIEDAICIAALFLCICRFLYRLKSQNKRWRTYALFLINENRWRAQRHGLEEGLVDFGKGKIVPCSELLQELISLLEEDISYFNCEKEVHHALTIVKRGTSAERQIKLYDALIAEGKPKQEALSSLVDKLIEETVKYTPGQ